MKWMLAALVAMTGCMTDEAVEPETDSDAIERPAIDVQSIAQADATMVAIHLMDCMPSMLVSGAGPYSVQCVVAYSASESGAQIEYVATDASGQTWVSARAAAPKAVAPQHGYTVFALESMKAPIGDAIAVKARIVDDALAIATNDIGATIQVRN
jgi:hypothetical protein